MARIRKTVHLGTREVEMICRDLADRAIEQLNWGTWEGDRVMFHVKDDLMHRCEIDLDSGIEVEIKVTKSELDRIAKKYRRGRQG